MTGEISVDRRLHNSVHCNHQHEKWEGAGRGTAGELDGCEQSHISYHQVENMSEAQVNPVTMRTRTFF